jgi:hypothetical protein
MWLIDYHLSGLSTLTMQYQIGHHPRFARDSRLEQLLGAALEESPNHMAISLHLVHFDKEMQSA